MNKKLFASVFIAAAAFVSTFASAAITYQNSNQSSVSPAAGYVQTGNALAAPGGPSVRANDLVITAGVAGTDIPANAEIIIRLPAGFNFDGAPSYLVAPAVPTQGLTLKDGTEFQDPTLNDPGIQLFDTDGDGGMDRALVEAGAAAAVGDMLTISMNVTASSAATVGNNKLASIIVNAGLAVTQPIANVVASLNETVQTATTGLAAVAANISADQVTGGATFTVTVPKGAAGSSTITFTPQSGVTWASTNSTISYVIHSPLTTAVFAQASGAVTATGGTATQTLNLNFAAADDIQVRMSINNAAPTGTGGVGLRGVSIAGTAGVSGVAQLIDVKANGSDATLAPMQTKASIVAGSAAAQPLPNILVTENFLGDSVNGTTPTLTLTAAPGLGFVTNAITVSNGWGLASANISGAGNSVLTLTFNAFGAVTPSYTISGLQAIASSSASGDLAVTVGSPGAPDLTTSPGDAVVVATAVPVGEVTVTGPTPVITTGKGVVGLVNNTTLDETTYGALTIAAGSQLQNAFFRATPSANATITGVTVTPNNYAATPPVFNACAAELGVTTGAWVCVQTGESTGIIPTTTTVTVAITYNVKTTAVVGDAVTVTYDGNNGVSGVVTMANVGVTTSATKGTVPDLTPGNTSAQSLASLSIKQNFPGSTKQGYIRLIAQAGVTFNNSNNVASTASPGSILGGTYTVTIADTFAPSDTLVIPVAATPTISFTPQAIIGPNVSEWVSFSIIDGDINGANGANVSAEDVMLAYADGTLGSIDAGADIGVNVNFSATNTVSGGLVAYTASSSDSGIAAASIDGGVLTVTGMSAGVATVTVNDQLGGPADTVIVTVSIGAAQPAAEKGAKTSDGSPTTATFFAGASDDGGDSYADTFSAGDDVTIVATVNVDGADQGSDGEVHVAIKSDTDSGTSFGFLNEDGDIEAWDLTLAGLGAAEVGTPLGATYNIIVFSGNLEAGTHRLALAYSVGGKLVYTGKAIVITVTP